MNFSFPEKTIMLYPSLAKDIGLEESILLSLLNDLKGTLQPKPSRSDSNRLWYLAQMDQLQSAAPFWNDYDIQRISQRLRERRILLLRSPPYTQCHYLDFAFNLGNNKQRSQSETTRKPFNTQRMNPTGTQKQTGAFAATPISDLWQPDQETLTGLSQLNIPEHFARDQVPEFVRYWRENGKSQRAWGSKFIQHVQRQWVYHCSHMEKANKTSTLPGAWNPSPTMQEQIAEEGIPVTFSQKVLNKFRLYHQNSGAKHLNWDLPFFSWVKEEWQKQDTPFIEHRKSTPMLPDWKPDSHTIEYLNVSYGIDAHFVEEAIPEFIHKWIEKKGIYSEWGKIFAEHVIEQWRFVQHGIEQNPVRKPITKQWQPSQECLNILTTQLEMDVDFIRQHLPEFILYWSNRGDPMFSWDNIFLRFMKQQWAYHTKASIGNTHERQYRSDSTRRSRDISLAERLTDRSWAN